MLQKIIAYLSKNKRLIRRNIRSNYTRPFKERSHQLILSIRHYLINIKHIFSRQNNLRFVGIMLVVFFFSRDFAFAEDKPTTFTNELVELLNATIAILTLLVHPMIMLAGWLLSPDWTFGDIIGLRPILHKMWIFIANIVYLIFAFLLIGIAIMNIFKEGGTNYSIKTALPRLIMGIIMVPFTWFIVSGTLSISNILTASVIQLPFETIKATGNDTINNIKIPQTIIFDLTDVSGSTVSEGYSEDGTVDKITLGDFLKSQNGAYNLLPFYAYGIMHIDKLQELSDNQISTSVKNPIDIVKKLFVGGIFGIVFCILVIAIVFALFSRMAMLWLYAIFSPLFAIGFFLHGKTPKKMESIGKFMEIKEFISLALVPVYVAAALSFGFMFVSLTSTITTTDTSFSSISECEGKTDCQIISQGNFDLQIRGNYFDSSDAPTDSTGKKVWNTASGMIGYIIVNTLSLGVLWLAVMAALGASKITEQAVAPIKSFGDSIGRMMSEMPKYMPIKVPGMGGKSMSLQGLQSMGSQLSSTISSAAQTQGTEYGSKLGKSLASSFGLTVDEGINKAQTYTNSTNINGITDKAKIGADLDKVLTLIGKDLSDFSNNASATSTFTNRISQIDDKLLNGQKKDIVDLLNKGGDANVSQAMGKLEHALGDGNFGGPSTELQNKEGVKKYFESKKAGTEVTGTTNTSGDLTGGITRTGKIEPEGDKYTLKLGNTVIDHNIHLDKDLKITDNAEIEKLKGLYKGQYATKEDLEIALKEHLTGVKNIDEVVRELKNVDLKPKETTPTAK